VLMQMSCETAIDQHQWRFSRRGTLRGTTSKRVVLEYFLRRYRLLEWPQMLT